MQQRVLAPSFDGAVDSAGLYIGVGLQVSDEANLWIFACIGSVESRAGGPIRARTCNWLISAVSALGLWASRGISKAARCPDIAPGQFMSDGHKLKLTEHAPAYVGRISDSAGSNSDEGGAFANCLTGPIAICCPTWLKSYRPGEAFPSERVARDWFWRLLDLALHWDPAKDGWALEGTLHWEVIKQPARDLHHFVHGLSRGRGEVMVAKRRRTFAGHVSDVALARRAAYHQQLFARKSLMASRWSPSVYMIRAAARAFPLIARRRNRRPNAVGAARILMLGAKKWAVASPRILMLCAVGALLQMAQSREWEIDRRPLPACPANLWLDPPHVGYTCAVAIHSIATFELRAWFKYIFKVQKGNDSWRS